MRPEPLFGGIAAPVCRDRPWGGAAALSGAVTGQRPRPGIARTVRECTYSISWVRRPFDRQFTERSTSGDYGYAREDSNLWPLAPEIKGAPFDAEFSALAEEFTHSRVDPAMLEIEERLSDN